MSNKTREIRAIENKYGPALFRMGLTHLADVGLRHLTDEIVTENIRRIREKGEEVAANGHAAIMTAEFQCEIVQCAAELARFDAWELFAYIKNHVAISIKGGNEKCKN